MDATRPPRVLIVDDSRLALAIARDILEEEGCEVFTYQTTFEGFLALRDQEPPDLMLIDLEMPGMKGDVFIATLRHSAIDITWPLLVFSGHEDAEERARAAGADGFVRKTGDPEIFLSFVLPWLNGEKGLEAEEEEGYKTEAPAL